MRRAAVLVVLLLAACSSGEGAATGGTGEVVFDGAKGQVRLAVEIADTQDARSRGLMWRSSLPPDTGMVFLWDAPSTTTFWMKDTRIPLSIAFWGQDGSIVTIRDMTPCTTEPCPTYAADAPFVGAAEAATGWFADHGVRVGDTARVLRDG
jgi:uncharacterized membrane protein (UPF0127 family)